MTNKNRKEAEYIDREVQDKLIQTAYEAKAFSYAPYSDFHVGAALLCEDGSVYTGCNIENAAFTPTNCAERTAIFKAVSEGRQDFKAIAIVGDKDEFLAPCGVCRQVMAEFVRPDSFVIIMTKADGTVKKVKLSELFPESFSPRNLC